MKKVNLTENEMKHYHTYKDVCKFESALEEFEWAETVCKECNKCNECLPLTCFGFSTSGRFPFDKNGVRYRRGECLDCTRKISRGKAKAKKLANTMGINLKPNDDDKCVLCDSKKDLVFDHDHEKNTFRGWLCDPCNRSLGTLESRLGDDWLKKLKSYVK
jgi:hypothetical protein